MKEKNEGARVLGEGGGSGEESGAHENSRGLLGARGRNEDAQHTSEDAKKDVAVEQEAQKREEENSELQRMPRHRAS